MVQWLRYYTPSWGTKILQTVWFGQKKKKKERKYLPKKEKNLTIYRV